MIELYKKYRPSKFGDMVGQQDVVRVLGDLGKRDSIPHAILLSGPSGCGKTTIARILKVKLKCADNDFNELNAADFRGIDMVREIRTRMLLAPMGGSCRVWLLDEVHQITGAAADALLKILEDTPAHVYFLLATTDPQKLKETIRTRCTEIKVKALGRVDMEGLLRKVAEAEAVKLEEEVLDRLVDHADGSPRKALVLLNAIIGIEDLEEQVRSIETSDHKAEAVKVAQVLMNPKASWGDVAKVLKDIDKDEDAEQLRWMVLGYARKVLLGGGKMAGRSFAIIQSFRDNFYDSKHAGLAAACWEVVHS